VGRGSGILAIAAVKRWPGTTCVAIDNDPIAVAATGENAGVNQVGDRISAAVTPVGELTEAYPLVLANIQAHVLRELREALIARTAPGGTLVLSGLLAPQAQPLADEFVAAGMTIDRIRHGEWTSVVLVKR
jgi:ribosomal protein L11 methyltransferase